MADKMNVANNPFAALFPSLGQAELYIASKDVSHQSVVSQQEQTASETPPRSLDEDDVKTLAKQKTDINNLLENIFLITLDKDASGDDDRPPRCVYMSDLACTLDEQTWLDIDCLEQAVFERLLLERPGDAVVCTQFFGKNPTDASMAGESQILRYLFHCYERCRNIQETTQYENYATVIEKSFEVILLNGKTCMQQSELYPSQVLHKQFIDLYMEENDYLSDNSVLVDFFTNVCKEIHSYQEDGTLLQVFTPVLHLIHGKFSKDFSIMYPEVNRYVDLLMFFTRTAPLAEVLMEFTAPKDWSKGIDFERTLLGLILSMSCLPLQDKPHTFFLNPSSASKQEHDNTEKNIWQPLSNIGSGVHKLLLEIIKLSPDLRHKVLSWLGKCIQANSGRAKIWSTQVLSQMYCSDGFSLNLCYVLLKLCQPFSTACSPKLLKIQPSYIFAIASDDADAKQRGIHAEGLNKETCLIPLEEGATGMNDEETYNFITESFFLCHQAINQGFHAVHEKFIKMNQDLHRIQRTYQDMRTQYPDDNVEPMRTYKMQMEKGMTMFLSLKAALTEPQLLEMSLKFHMATATWLIHVASSGDFTQFKPVTFPLPEEVPVTLAYCPEFIMGNITDFTMFLHRFKDQLYESGGDGLAHFMTLILVFMGSPERMKNPHLRAELAETLAALMPQNSNISGGILSKYYREHLFEKHELIKHLSEKLLHVFVSIEMTGQSVQFEQKFNYRRPMYQVLHYIWETQLHKDAITELAQHAEVHIEDTNPPLFLRFINLLINDAIFLLDEAMDFMKQLKEKQQVKESPEWQNMTPRQKQEHEANVRQIGNMARYHNVMGNQTILTLAMITKEIKTIFCHEMMVDRIASMLNYFLLQLVGPKQRDLKVKDKNEFEFKPGELVLDITKIYLNLGENDDFCKAVTGDGRSYSDMLLPKAIQVLQRIGTSPAHMSDFEDLHVKICAIGKALQEEEELLADAPEEFLDPIMGTLMKDPVILPTSNNIVDRSIISRHILSDQMDPFNRQPLTLDMVVPADDLRNRIHAWINEQRTKQS